jgi:hypothetical protein
MKCYYVLVHGRLDWDAVSPATENHADAFRPAGFWCHRYVLASTVYTAQEVAFRRVRENLDRRTGWLTAKAARLQLEAEETVQAPIFKLLKPDNRGHTFYDEEN